MWIITVFRFDSYEGGVLGIFDSYWEAQKTLVRTFIEDLFYGIKPKEIPEVTRLLEEGISFGNVDNFKDLLEAYGDEGIYEDEVSRNHMLEDIVKNIRIGKSLLAEEIDNSGSIYRIIERERYIPSEGFPSSVYVGDDIGESEREKSPVSSRKPINLPVLPKNKPVPKSISYWKDNQSSSYLSPVHYRYPSPIRSPSPERYRSPSPVRSPSPERYRSPSPVRYKSTSSSPFRSTSPVSYKSTSPSPFRSLSPVSYKSTSPIRYKSS